MAAVIPRYLADASTNETMKMEFAGNMSLSIEVVPPKDSISVPDDNR
jgi:hypothetical protein